MADTSSRPFLETRAGFDRLGPPMLAFVAGFVDSCSYLGLFGLFTAQVTGSFVVAGAQLARAEGGVIVKLLAIPIYILGVVLATLVIRWCRRNRRSPLGVVLVFDAVLLAGFLVAGWSGGPFLGADQAASIATATFALAAMGAQSALVRLLFKGMGPTTFMTGNTTQFGIDVTEWALAWLALRRSPSDAGAAQAAAEAAGRAGRVLSLLGGFLAGAASGALGFALLGFTSVVVAIAVTLLAGLWALALRAEAG